MNDSDLLFDFIRRSPSPWHAVKTAAEALEKAGYARLEERESWTLTPGGKYYTTRGGSPPPPPPAGASPPPTPTAPPGG